MCEATAEALGFEKVAVQLLSDQGYKLGDVPPAGETVKPSGLIQRSRSAGSLSMGYPSAARCRTYASAALRASRRTRPM